MNLASPPHVPLPPVQEDPDALAPGDCVAFPAPTGPAFELSFGSPFESFLRLEGDRVLEHRDPQREALLLWQGRHLPGLYRLLEHRRGLRGSLVEGRVVVTDLYDFAEDAFVDHVRMRQWLAPLPLLMPAFALLGPLSTRVERRQRLRSLFALGTRVELRSEEGGQVRSRLRLVVGRD